MESFEGAVEGVRPCTSLEVLYLEHTPLSKEWEYRIRVAKGIPSLKQLDATPVSRWNNTGEGGGGGGGGGRGRREG